ncbi:MAG: formylmethanofuran dehydrogenase subunit A [Chloroflexi bacterium]|nr:MAG: formylmethanofuran dehydrogenase subunit A [Chloroflexota bacterium]
MTLILVRGGTLIDPAYSTEGIVRDLWVSNGRIVSEQEGVKADEVIDAAGMLVAPGAIEIHTHIAGDPLALARRLCLHEIDEEPLLPPSAQIAKGYLKLGFTTLFDAAMFPGLAWRTHTDFDTMAGVDRGAFTLVSDHAAVARAVEQRNPQILRAVLARLLKASGGYAVKLVNPGAGIAWEKGQKQVDLDTPSLSGSATQRDWLLLIAAGVQEMGLPHPVHIHSGDLGHNSSWMSFSKTAGELEGLPAHLCHIQFYSYAEDSRGRMISAAENMVKLIDAHPELTFDSGVVTLTPAYLLSADIQAIDSLHKILKTTWSRVSVHGEGSYGLLPVQYDAHRADSAVQWAIGLEMLLLSPDPTRLFMTCDFPNGGSFTAYPHLVSLLMDRSLRSAALKSVHNAASQRTGIGSIEREYSISEVIAMTSTGPARALGLLDRGHLGVGACADIRCYRPSSDHEYMFTNPAWVMKDGQVCVRDGRFEPLPEGHTLVVQPEEGLHPQGEVDRLFESFSPDYLNQYKLSTGSLEVVPCRSRA